jgi:hypothetical protein
MFRATKLCARPLHICAFFAIIVTSIMDEVHSFWWTHVQPDAKFDFAGL